MFRDMREIPEPRLLRYGPVFERWFRREVRREKLTGLLVETESGEVVAGALLWLQPRTPSPRFPQQEVPYIMSVYTEPAHRGRGLASRVVRALVASARRQGYPRVELHATERAQSLYARLGFRPTNQMRVTFTGGRSSRNPRATKRPRSPRAG